MSTDIAYLAASNGSRIPVSVAKPLPTSMIDATSGAAVSWGFTPTEITTKTTTLVKSGAGMCGGITINKTGATDVVTVYDALTATGTPIATITTALVGQVFLQGANFAIGLCIVTSGGTAGNYGVLVA